MSNIKTLTTLRSAFWIDLYAVNPDLYREAKYSPRKRQAAYGATVRTAWVDYVDRARKSGWITEKLARRATL